MSRLFLLGIDGLPPSTFRRFVAEGIMPHCARLLTEAAELDVVPTLPALTAPGWLTIASGAHPGTLGVSNILLPSPGTTPDTVRNGFDRAACDAEYLWESLVDSGLPATVVKYPGSWPPRTHPLLTQVDGAGGYADITCRFEEVPSAAYVAGLPLPATGTDGCCSVPRGYQEHWRIDSAIDGGAAEVVPREPLPWSGLPGGWQPSFEAVLPVRPNGDRAKILLHLLAGRHHGRPVVLLSRSKRHRDTVAEIGVGEWSSWVPMTSTRGEFSCRYRLVELDLTERRLRLYRSEGHRHEGFTEPATLAGELRQVAGPPAEWTGTFDYFAGLLDLEGQLDLYDAHTAWLERVVGHLAARDWHGFFLHWHVIEYAHHIAGASLDDTHPDHREGAEAFLPFMRETYRLMDRLVGRVTEVLEPGDALALVSDHGHDVVHTLFYVNEFLRRHEWLATVGDGDHQEVDWSRSVGYGLFPGLILINGKDRWAVGSVDAAEADVLAAEIATALRALVDPRTGRPVVTAVLNRAEMAAYGQFGPYAPDLFFTMDRGYEPATRLGAPGGPMWERTIPGHDLTSGHGSFHPSSPSARTLALLRHAAIAPGSSARYPVPITDLAPTFAALMGVRAPRRCDGRALDLHALGIARRDQ